MTVTPEEQPENPLNPDEPAAPDAAPDEPNPDEEQPEQIEGDDTDQQEQEPEQEQPPSSLALSVEQEKALAREQKRHTENIGKILGDDATDAIVCPFCNPELQGFLYAAELQHPRDDVHARMIAVLAPKPATEYVQSTSVGKCADCRGRGQVKTGSEVPNQELIACSNCKGFGYYPPPGLPSNGGISGDDLRELVAVGGPETLTDDYDNWGHPKLLATGLPNPNYGRQPQYIDPNYP